MPAVSSTLFHDELLVALGIKLYEGFNEASLDLSTFYEILEDSTFEELIALLRPKIE